MAFQREKENNNPKFHMKPHTKLIIAKSLKKEEQSWRHHTYQFKKKNLKEVQTLKQLVYF